VEAEDAARALDDRQVDQLATERDRCLARGLRLFKSVNDASGVLDLRLPGTEHLVDDVNLTRVESRLP